MLRTLVLGASEKPDRYSNQAVLELRKHNHEVVAVGSMPGIIGDTNIQTAIEKNENVHTVTLYLNPDLQKQYYDAIIRIQPKRIIFNPGTENKELKELADKNGIKTLEACTLVLLRTDQYE
jgi:predicted CoA-binding protein